MSPKVRTIEDLARIVKVSPSTISRVFSNDPRISERTRKKVLELAREHEFRPVRRKRSVSNRELRILLITPSFNYQAPHIMDEAMLLFDGLSNAFTGARRILEVMKSEDLVESMKDSRRIGDGVISVFHRLDEDICRKLTKAGIPYIHLNRTVSPYVSSNDYKGFSKIISHLSDKGYRNPAFLNFSLHPRSEERKAAYRAGMIQYFPDSGHYVQDIPEPGSVSPELMKTFVEEGRDAVVCFNDEIALRTFSACADAGIAIPGDLAITGYDDVPAAALSTPRLTTVRLPVYHVARLAGMWLRDVIRDRDTPPICLEVTGELIPGGSS